MIKEYTIDLNILMQLFEKNQESAEQFLKSIDIDKLRREKMAIVVELPINPSNEIIILVKLLHKYIGLNNINLFSPDEKWAYILEEVLNDADDDLELIVDDNRIVMFPFENIIKITLLVLSLIMLVKIVIKTIV